MDSLETIAEEEELFSSNLSRKKEEEELFLVCDRERKGYVTVNDLHQLREELGLSVEQIKTVFGKLDKDNDGHITAKEFTEGLEVFFKQSTLNSNNHTGVENKKLESAEIVAKTNLADRRKLFQDSYYERIARSNNSSEILGILHSNEIGQQFWSFMQAEHPELVPYFEDFLHGIAMEHRKIKDETVILQESFNKKSLAYEEQIQTLYEEMEVQIQKERDDIALKKLKLEQELRYEFQEARNTKDKDIQDILEKWFLAENELQTAKELKTLTTQENQKLLQEKEELEHELEVHQRKMMDLVLQLEEIREEKLVEKRQQFKSAFQLSEKIAWEKETLDKQLSLLRSINKRLIDDQDEQVTTETVNISDPVSVTAVMPVANTVAGLNSKRGSIMADYFGIFPSNNELDDDVFGKCSSGSQCVENSVVHKSVCAPALCLVHPIHRSVSAAHHSQERGIPRRRASILMPNSNSFDVNENETMVQNSDTSDCSVIGTCTKASGSSRNWSSDAANDAQEATTLPQFIFKVVFIGDSAVGKTSLINRMCNIQFQENISTTIGVDFRIRSVVCDGREVVMQLWDTAGQERFRSITSQYMRRSDAVVIVYDVTSEASYTNVAHWVANLQVVNNENAVIMLIGNKIDCEKTVVTTKDGERLAQDIKDAVFIETSAKDEIGIEDLVYTLARKLHRHQLEDMDNALRLTKKLNTAKRKKCCW